MDVISHKRGMSILTGGQNNWSLMLNLKFCDAHDVIPSVSPVDLHSNYNIMLATNSTGDNNVLCTYLSLICVIEN